MGIQALRVWSVTKWPFVWLWEQHKKPGWDSIGYDAGFDDEAEWAERKAREPYVLAAKARVRAARLELKRAKTELRNARVGVGISQEVPHGGC